MKHLVCKYCGGNDFIPTKNGYECTYCHAQYEFDNNDEEQEVNNSQKFQLKKIYQIILLFVILCSLLLFPIIKSTENLQNSNVQEKKQATLTTSESSEYLVSQLKNPERNVMIAELSLNQEALSLAKASVEQYGGKKTAEYEKRLAIAQKEHDQFEKKRQTTAPKADMLIENPNSELSVTTYYRENSFYVAYGPDYDQYSAEDILRIWGQPDEIITDSAKINESLSIIFDAQNNPENYETKMITEQWLNGQLTFREVHALQLFVMDNAYANFTKEFVYQSQGKPNVYFNGDQVGYVTPILSYVSFSLFWNGEIPRRLHRELYFERTV